MELEEWVSGWIIKNSDNRGFTVHQYHRFMYNHKLTLQRFEISPKSKETEHFYLVLL